VAQFVVAIDGYAGSGKSTTAKAVAQRLNFLYLDTGAMYRAFTYKYLKRVGAEKIDPAVVKELLRDTRIDLVSRGDQTRVILDGQDVSREIRTPQVNSFVSPIAAVPEIREYMVKRQREIAADQKVVCEGRDITSVVFPNAQVKIYMDADLKTRALRRQKELMEKGIGVTLDDVMNNLKFRDDYDSGRQHSPLRRTADSILVDTTNLTIEEEIDLVEKIVREKINSFKE
jgi:cytidylate kinase